MGEWNLRTGVGAGSPLQPQAYFRQINFMKDCMEVKDLDTDIPESPHAQVSMGSLQVPWEAHNPCLKTTKLKHHWHQESCMALSHSGKCPGEEGDLDGYNFLSLAPTCTCMLPYPISH